MISVSDSAKYRRFSFQYLPKVLYMSPTTGNMFDLLLFPEMADRRKEHIQRDPVRRIRQTFCAKQRDRQAGDPIICEPLRKFDAGKEALFSAHDDDDRPVTAFIRLGTFLPLSGAGFPAIRHRSSRTWAVPLLCH